MVPLFYSLTDQHNIGITTEVPLRPLFLCPTVIFKMDRGVPLNNNTSKTVLDIKGPREGESVVPAHMPDPNPHPQASRPCMDFSDLCQQSEVGKCFEYC